jgi:hypothetical protein
MLRDSLIRTRDCFHRSELSYFVLNHTFKKKLVNIRSNITHHYWKCAQFDYSSCYNISITTKRIFINSYWWSYKKNDFFKFFFSLNAYICCMHYFVCWRKECEIIILLFFLNDTSVLCMRYLSATYAFR